MVHIRFTGCSDYLVRVTHHILPRPLQASVSYEHMAEYLSTSIYLPALAVSAVTLLTHTQPLLLRCLLRTF